MSKTVDNLMAAFAGESQANRKYLAFAAKAEEEGYMRAARMFKAAAMAETIHALSHFKSAGKVGTTAENLKAAFEGETYEYENMYPPMIDQAKADGDRKAERSFSLANEAEKGHAALYKDVLDKLDKGADSEFHVCKVCGHVEEGGAPDKCKVCGAGKSAFDKVE